MALLERLRPLSLVAPLRLLDQRRRGLKLLRLLPELRLQELKLREHRARLRLLRPSREQRDLELAEAFSCCWDLP